MFDQADKTVTLGNELYMVDDALARVGVPKPISFGWPGDNFGPEALEQLRRHGIKLACRGMQLEVPYGEVQVGPPLDFIKNSPLLIPTTGDAYPDWTLAQFNRVVAEAKEWKGGSTAIPRSAGHRPFVTGFGQSSAILRGEAHRSCCQPANLRIISKALRLVFIYNRVFSRKGRTQLC